MMIPGFEPMNLKPVNIIFETEDKLDEIFGSVTEWVQIQYYNVRENQKLYETNEPKKGMKKKIAPE